LFFVTAKAENDKKHEDETAAQGGGDDDDWENAVVDDLAVSE